MGTGVVIYHERLGVYLGSCMGMGFWSKLDDAGQDSAVTFVDRETAEAVIESWDEPVQHCLFVNVEVDIAGQYASIASCERAGLPAWTPWRPAYH